MASEPLQTVSYFTALNTGANSIMDWRPGLSAQDATLANQAKIKISTLGWPDLHRSSSRDGASPPQISRRLAAELKTRVSCV